MALMFASCHDHFSHAAPLAQETASANIAGKWTVSIDTPHGNVTGTMQLEQSGGKVTGTLAAGQFGTLSLTGTVDGAKVSFSVYVTEPAHYFTFSGTVDGARMSGLTMIEGPWSGTRE